jgi:hypothetical protein
MRNLDFHLTLLEVFQQIFFHRDVPYVILISMNLYQILKLPKIYYEI